MIAICVLALLDLFAAFDTADHYILLQRMQVNHNISDSALIWFESYFTSEDLGNVSLEILVHKSL